MLYGYAISNRQGTIPSLDGSLSYFMFCMMQLTNSCYLSFYIDMLIDNNGAAAEDR